MAAVLCLPLQLLLLLGWLRDSGEAAVVDTCAGPDPSHIDRPCACGPAGSACVRKCCGLDEAMYLSNKSCIAAPVADPLMDFLSNNTFNHSIAGDGSPCPCGRYPLGAEDGYGLLDNGSLWSSDHNHLIVSFCMENLVLPDDQVTVVTLACFACDEPPLVAGVFWQGVMKLVKYWGMLLSAPFLLATLFVYAAVPRLRNLHGKTLMCHVAALLVAYVLLPLLGILHVVEGPVCQASAFIIYFAFLASFFWLNVMCLDIWWTFSGFRPMRGSVKEREHKKFIIYSLYCWGSPLIMLIICMVMDLHPGIPDHYVKPGFGELKCWFKSHMANFIYFSGPIAILIVCNIVLFILTAVKIRQVKRGTKILKKQDSRRHNEEEENNTQRFNLYLKLFLVMGVNWIMEIVSFAAGGPDEYWYITDIANTLQGVLIFIIFVWKDRIRKLLVERFCPSRAANSNSLANSSSTRTTAIRHNGSVMSSGRPSFRNNKEDYPMKTLTSVRSDDSDIA